MKTKQKPKTHKFILLGLILWISAIVLFGAIFFIRFKFGDITNEHTGSGFLYDLSLLILNFGVFGIPIVMVFALVLFGVKKLFENKP